MDDKILVVQCKNGSREALRQIYQKYRDYLLVVAVAFCHNVETAEDAVHDTFVGFAERLPEFELTGSLKSYLAVCVANRVRDGMRERQRRKDSLGSDCPDVVSLNDPSRAVICSEELQQLSSALAELPAEQREIVVLHIYGDMRFNAIAQSLDISVNTAKGRYRYGIAKLRSIVKDEVKQ